MKFTTMVRAATGLGAALALAACAQEEPSYETDTEDLSGGELQVADPAAEGVEVDVPETEMTTASQDEIEAAHAEDGADQASRPD